MTAGVVVAAAGVVAAVGWEVAAEANSLDMPAPQEAVKIHTP